MTLQAGRRFRRILCQTQLVRCYSSGSKPAMSLSGIFPAIPTPFNNDDYSIAYDKLEKNFETWNKKDFSGYVVLGSNGEAISLQTEEKIELLKQVRRLAKPSQTIVAGTGCHSTTETIELTKEVAKSGSADAVLIVTPSFYRGRMTDNALQTHYEAVADASPLPIILYSVPRNTNLDLSAEVIIKLSHHSNIIGIKDSGGDMGKMTRLVHATKDQNFQISVGSAGILLPALLMGCVGAINGLSNILGDEVCQIYRLFQEKDVATAVPLQQRLAYLNTLVTATYGVSGLKAMMDRTGLYGGPPRPPLLPADSSDVEHIAEVFKKENFLK